MLHNFDVKPNAKFNANMLLGFQIHFSATLNNHLVHIVSLPVCKNNIIHCTMFVLVWKNVKTNPFSENTVIVCVSFTCILPPLSENTGLTGVVADRLQ